MKYLRRQLQDYQPVCEQEERDREIMLAFLRDHPDCPSRENSIAHFTASSWIVNEDRDKVLMVITTSIEVGRGQEVTPTEKPIFCRWLCGKPLRKPV